MTKFQKTIVILLSILIGIIILFVGYHFLVTIPNEKKTEYELKQREIQLKEEQANFEIEQAQKQEQAILNKENNYNSCIYNAEKNYNSLRAKSCTDQYNEEYDRYIKCLGGVDNDTTNPYCKTLITTKKGDSRCQLNRYNGLGSQYNSILEKAKKECIELYK